jgi:hypothetical protein
MWFVKLEMETFARRSDEARFNLDAAWDVTGVEIMGRRAPLLVEGLHSNMAWNPNPL